MRRPSCVDQATTNARYGVRGSATQLEEPQIASSFLDSLPSSKKLCTSIRKGCCADEQLIDIRELHADLVMDIGRREVE